MCRYANRAKNIKNKPHINEDPKDALLREYQDEITRLKMALEKRKKGGVRQKRKKVNAQGEGTCVLVHDRQQLVPSGMIITCMCTTLCKILVLLHSA